MNFKKRMRSFPCIGGGANGRYLFFDHPPGEVVLNVGFDDNEMPIQEIYFRERLNVNDETFYLYRNSNTNLNDAVCMLFINYKKGVD